MNDLGDMAQPTLEEIKEFVRYRKQSENFAEGSESEEIIVSDSGSSTTSEA